MDNNYQTEVNLSSKKNNNVTTILIILIIIVLGIFIFFLVNNNKKTGVVENVNSNCISSDASDISKEGNLYKINAQKLDSNECVIYKLDDDFTIKYEKIDEYRFKQYVNDKLLVETDLLESFIDSFIYSKDTNSYVHPDRNKIITGMKNNELLEEDEGSSTELQDTKYSDVEFEYLKFGKNLLYNNIDKSNHDDRQDFQLLVLDKNGNKSEINPYYRVQSLSNLSINNNEITIPYNVSFSFLGRAGIYRIKDKNNNSRELIYVTPMVKDVNRIKNTYRNLYNVELGNPITLEELLNEFGDYIMSGEYTYTLNSDGTFNLTPSINVTKTITQFYNEKNGDLYIK